MANLYFTEELGAEAFAPGEVVTVTGDEAHHAVRVSRLRVGEESTVGDGRGTLVHGAVVAVDRDRFTLSITEVSRVPAPAQRLVLVQALAKGGRDERAVEQATEFGVDAIVPWQADRSVSRWEGDKAAKGVAKWQRIAREAAKQSVRAWIPEVQPPVSLATLLERVGAGAARLIALHPRGARKLTELAVTWQGDCYLVVGPEGGFSDRELEAVEGAAAAEIRVLGDTVLRTSSAGPAAIAVLNAALGRW